MPQNTEQQDVIIIKADRSLQAKIGSGPLDEKLIEKSQRIIDNNTEDFAPIAEDLLNQLKNTISKSKTNDTEEILTIIEEMRTIVMQLKANAGTFKYPLVSNLANIMLGFLESIQSLNQDSIKIIEAHHQTLSIIMKERIQEGKGNVGQKLEQELKDACKRYFHTQ